MVARGRSVLSPPSTGLSALMSSIGNHKQPCSPSRGNLQGSADWNMLIYLPVHESEQPLWWLYQSHLAGKRRCPAVSLATRGTNVLMHTGLCGLTRVSEDQAGVSAALVREWHPRLGSQHFPGHVVLCMWSLERVPLHGCCTSALTGPKRNFTVC